MFGYMNIARVGIILGILATCALPQSPPPNPPAFEVVSVKPHEVPEGRVEFRLRISPGPPVPIPTGNRFTERAATMQDLIMDAYGVEAKARGDEAPTSEQLRLMLQNMLADRFQLKLHREMRPLPVYALVVAGNGPQVREITKEAFDAQPRYGRMPARWPERTQTTMTMFVNSLARQVDRPVLDRTGLTGYYELATPEWMQPDWDRRSDPVAAQGAVMSELEAKVGLKLESRKDPVEVLVIDHVAMPSPN
jgi:hypothetical protein